MQGGVPIPEAAVALGLSERTVRRKIKSGELDAYEVHTVHGMAWRVVLPAGDGRQSLSSVVSTVAKPLDNDLGVILAEVRELRERLADLALLLPAPGPPDPGPPVTLTREEYPHGGIVEPVAREDAGGGFWLRLRAWLGGGG